MAFAALAAGRRPRCAGRRSDAGHYQAVLGDCAGCHGKNLAGGVALMTPFGKLVTPNITPDRDTGIGNYRRRGFPPGDEGRHRAGRQAALSRHALSLLCAHDATAMSAALWAYMQDRQAGAATPSTSTSCAFPSTCAS